MKVVFNGEIQEEKSIEVSPFSLSAQYGYSVFETFRTDKKGNFFLLDRHLERLARSMELISLAPPDSFRWEELKNHIFQLKESYPSRPHRFKILVTEDFWWIKAWELAEMEVLKDGLRVTSVIQERIFPEAKTGNPIYRYYQKYLAQTSFDEVIFFSKSGYLREGNITNVFVIYPRKIVKTPNKEILPGVMRGYVLEQLAALGYSVDFSEQQEAEILRDAVGVFLTNTIRGVRWVRQWGEKRWELPHPLITDLQHRIPF